MYTLYVIWRYKPCAEQEEEEEEEESLFKNEEDFERRRRRRKDYSGANRSPQV